MSLTELLLRDLFTLPDLPFLPLLEADKTLVEANDLLSLIYFFENSSVGFTPSRNSFWFNLASASKSNLLIIEMSSASLGNTPVLIRYLFKLVVSIYL